MRLKPMESTFSAGAESFEKAISYLYTHDKFWPKCTGECVVTCKPNGDFYEVTLRYPVTIAVSPDAALTQKEG